MFWHARQGNDRDTASALRGTRSEEPLFGRTTTRVGKGTYRTAQRGTVEFFEEERMRDPMKLRSMARKCRNLAKIAMSPVTIAQLRLWAAELAETADERERENDRNNSWKRVGLRFGSRYN